MQPVPRLLSSTDHGVRGPVSGAEGIRMVPNQEHTPAISTNQKLVPPTVGTTKLANPLNQAVLANAVTPSVVEVNVSATKPVSSITERGRTPKSTTVNAEHDRSEPRASDVNSNRHQKSRFSEDAFFGSSTNAFDTTRSMLDEDKHPPRRISRTGEAQGDIREVSNHLRPAEDELISPKTLPISLDGSSNERDGVRMAKESGNLTSPTNLIAEGNPSLPTTKGFVPTDGGAPAARSRALRSLPGFTQSRGSSTDTAGGSSVNTNRRRRSVSQDVVYESGRTSLSAANIKATATTQTSGDPRGVNVVLSQIKSKVLSKEYWMRDENAKDCFYCGDVFSTFRRKHHCSECETGNRSVKFALAKPVDRDLWPDI
jgi:hypothetical protein